MSRLGSAIIAGALFALATIFAVRAENMHVLILTTPLLAAICLRRLRLQWVDLAKAVLFSTLIMALEWRQNAVFLGLLQMLGVSLLVLVDPRARQTAPKVVAKPTDAASTDAVSVDTQTAEKPVQSPATVQNTVATQSTAIPCLKIVFVSLLFPTAFLMLSGGRTPEAIEATLIFSMCLSLFFGLVAFVLALIKEVRAAAVVGGMGAVLLYTLYALILLYTKVMGVSLLSVFTHHLPH
jgi:hypothetical protein